MASLTIVECPSCNKQFSRTVKQVNVVVKRSGRWMCKSCVNTIKNLSKAKKVGYIRIKKQNGRPEIKTESGFLFLHTHVMETHLGRKLIRGEVVHHLDGDIHNNHIGNLIVMTNAQHTRLHNLIGRGKQRENIQNG